MASWGEDIVEGMRERRRERELEPVLEGYQAAADICIGGLATVLDRIEAKVDAGEPLSSDEKVLRTELHVIKSKVERRLRDYWQEAYRAN